MVAIGGLRCVRACVCGSIESKTVVNRAAFFRKFEASGLQPG